MLPQDDLIAVAPFGITRKDQHLIDDDAWYAGFLMEHVRRFVYVAGAYSADLLKTRFQNVAGVSIVSLPEPTSRLRYEYDVVRYLAKQLRGRRAVRVLFFGYSERMMLLAAPVLLSKQCQVTLVNTNNLSQRRLDKYRWPMWLMHVLLQRQIVRIIVHSKHEKKMLLSRFPFLEGKTVIKKHHMLLPDPSILDPRPNGDTIGSTIISCFGPITADKSVEVISAVIQHIVASDSVVPPIEIRIFKIAQEMLPDVMGRYEGINISFFPDFLEAEEYRLKIRESDLIVMNHTDAFEGKLSGIFCDCVALGVPFLGLDIEPLASFNTHHNGVGFLLDSESKNNWQKQIASATDPVSLAKAREKIMLVAQEFEKSELDADYLSAFDVQTEIPNEL